MGLDYDAARFWWEVGMTLGLLVNVAYQYVLAKGKANKEAIDAIAETVDDIDTRVTTLESEVRHLPDHEDLSEIHEKVNAIANGMGVIQGELAALNRTLGLINDHLLNHGGRR